MTLVWENLSICSIIIDGRSYVPHSKTLEINLENGIHKIDILISNISFPQLRKKILLNWISNFCGAIVYTIKDAVLDAYDDKISFNFTIDDCNALLNLDNYILLKSDTARTKMVNVKKINLVRNLYLLPLILFGSALGVTFLTLGIITIQHNNIGIGIFSIVIATLSLILTIGLVAKTIKQTKKRPRM